MYASRCPICIWLKLYFNSKQTIWWRFTESTNKIRFCCLLKISALIGTCAHYVDIRALFIRCIQVQWNASLSGHFWMSVRQSCLEQQGGKRMGTGWPDNRSIHACQKRNWPRCWPRTISTVYEINLWIWHFVVQQMRMLAYFRDVLCMRTLCRCQHKNDVKKLCT